MSGILYKQQLESQSNRNTSMYGSINISAIPVIHPLLGLVDGDVAFHFVKHSIEKLQKVTCLVFSRLLYNKCCILLRKYGPEAAILHEAIHCNV